jgi:hypothetical protein
MAEGGHHPNPHATQVLTHLDDGNLISRGGVVRAVTSKGSSGKRRIPLWVVVTLLVSVIAVAAIVLFKPDNGFGLVAAATAVPPEAATATTEPATSELIMSGAPTAEATAVSTDTPLPTPSVTLTPVPTETPLPTELPTDTPSATPTIAPLPVCEGALPTRLSVGDKARVINFQINVRSGPGTNFGVVNTLLPGRQVDIVEGPECNDGQLWYHIISELFTNSAGDQIQVEGWSVEESDDTYFLEPTN